tara:strand:+ start:7483 stop:9261 length:1779 start_codon:yes stop_codon:yes gene_type:complete
MSDKIINLELRQVDSDSVRSNGDWSSILSKGIQINSGDEVVINKVFIDNVDELDNIIKIPNDIIATMTFYLYTTSIKQQNVALGSDGKRYYSNPVVADLATVDGFDYILCEDVPPPTVTQEEIDAGAADMKLVTVIEVRSKEDDGNFSKAFGDESGDNPCILGYYDKDGAQQTFYIEIPYKKHIPKRGLKVQIAVSLIMDISKGFFITDMMSRLFELQNVSTKLKNFVIITDATPTQNYLQPIVINHDILISKGTYTSSNMISLLNNSFQTNRSVDFAQETLSASTFPSNQLLRRIMGCTAPKLVSTQTTKTHTRIMEQVASNTIDFFVGCNDVSINYDDASKKFFFENLHFPLYDTAASGAITTSYQSDTISGKAFFIGKNSGVNIHSFSAVNNDSTLDNYNKYFDFWTGQLGFNEEDISCKSSMTPPQTVNGVSYIVPIFTQYGNGISTTCAKPILDNVVIKATSPYKYVDVENIYNTSDLTVPVIASESRLDKVSLDYGYYLIEINNGLSSELIGQSYINRTISCIVNRYYSLGTFTSGDISGSLSYIHEGPSLYLKNFNIRILDSNKKQAIGLEQDNSIFISVIKASS